MLSNKKRQLIIASAIISLAVRPTILSASLIDDLKAKLSSSASKVQQLQKEITQYQQAITTTKQQSASLSSEIKKIDTTRQKISTDINVTEKNITKTNQALNQISSELYESLSKIEQSKLSLAESLRQLNRQENTDLIEIILSASSLSDILNQAQSLSTLQKEVDQNIFDLSLYKTDLEKKKAQQEATKNNLTSLKGKLADQKTIADQTKKQKDALLQETKNKEANYQKLLADRLKKMQEVQQEIAEIEAQVRVIVDPKSLPKGSVLIWPVDKVVITQGFGNTAFAASHSAVYNGSGHNAIDLGMPVGTPVKAALGGKIVATADTDAQCNKVSFGKYVFIEHDNGLSTLYAHLSLIKVSEGQRVETGQVIGYSGNTGYSTGPHLHFGVYATQGVVISQPSGPNAYISKSCGVYLKIPISTGGTKTYLNPMLYLGNI